MCDVSGLTNCTIDQNLPTIMIGHHNLNDLYESQVKRILRSAATFKISAYFSGDIHRFKSDTKNLKPYDNLPCYSCPKFAPQSGDSYSDIGIMFYTWNRQNNKVTVQAFKWTIDKGFLPNPDYLYDVDKEDYFMMKLPRKGISSSIQLSSKSSPAKIDYIDRIAKQAYNNGTGNELVNLILLQNNRHSKKTSTTLDSLYEDLVNSKHGCSLLIDGQPGTGKSSLMTLLYLKTCEVCDQSISWTYYFNLQYFDRETVKSTEKTLTNEIQNIECNINCHKQVFLFFDGLNEYKRLKYKQEQLLRGKIEQWRHCKHVRIVCSVGIQDGNRYPPFSRFNIASPINAEKAIHLEPINIQTKKFRRLINGILKINGVSSQISNSNDFIRYCGLMDGDTSTFRTGLFLVDRYLHVQDNLFKQDVAVLIENYFREFHSQEQIVRIADNAVDFLLGRQKNLKIDPDCLKGDAFLDFFFATSYINFLIQESKNQDSKNKLAPNELKKAFQKFDCVFTVRINRFAVQLMCNNQETEETVSTFIMENFNCFPAKAKLQAIYMLGRVRNTKIIDAVRQFLLQEFEQSVIYFINSEKRNIDVMILRSIGISLLKLGCISHEDKFYELLIYDENMSRINRHFHITYYMSSAYNMTDNDVIDNQLVCDFKNIKRTYDFLYHSIKIDENPKQRYVNIITVIDLVLNYIYSFSADRKDASNYFENFRGLIKTLAQDATLVNSVVKDYVTNINIELDKEDPYVDCFSQIYGLKGQLRKGWTDRGIEKKQRTESVADHIWACCMLAQMLLPDNVHDSELIDKDECSPESDYNKQKVISYLLVHDLPESITGDIPSPQKTSADEKNEQNAIVKISTMSSFPYLSPMRSVFNLCKEFSRSNSINVLLAYDIDKLEPLIQLYLYRCSLEPPYDFSVADNWISSLNLRTQFGIHLLNLIKSHFINPNAFKKEQSLFDLTVKSSFVHSKPAKA